MCKAGTTPPEHPTAVDFHEQLARLLLAVLLGGALGFERELQQKSAGLRTNILIALGAALFTMMSAELVPAGLEGDPSRVAAQIVTGIGFLGAGAILRTGAGVRGLTTAATIWVNAAIGMAAGGGQYTLAIAATAATLLALTALSPLERYLDARDERRRSGRRADRLPVGVSGPTERDSDGRSGDDTAPPRSERR